MFGRLTRDLRDIGLIGPGYSEADGPMVGCFSRREVGPQPGIHTAIQQHTYLVFIHFPTEGVANGEHDAKPCFNRANFQFADDLSS